VDAGLFFICFQQDPRRQFIPIQQRLAAHDALNGFIQHRASAVFACPGGVGETGWVGEQLFA
jgi:deferrochelatase/peroxidase EfeB